MRPLLPLLLVCAAALVGCAAPAPTPVAGGAARLDPDVVLFDRVDFRTDRELAASGEEICQYFGAENPYREGTGCSFELPARNRGTFDIEANEFRLYWLGRVSSFYRGFAHSERVVLLERYHAVEVVDAAFLTRPCTVAIDVGGPRALTVTVSPPDDVDNRLAEGVALPLAESLSLCAVARSYAEGLLTTFDPDGGSVVG